MANSFVDKPQLVEPFPDTPPLWKDLVTGWRVPKVPTTNLKWRAELLAKAKYDRGF